MGQRELCERLADARLLRDASGHQHAIELFRTRGSAAQLRTALRATIIHGRAHRKKAGIIPAFSINSVEVSIQ